MLFEVAIVESPTKAEQDAGVLERLVFGPKCVVARDSQTAALKAMMGESQRPEFNSDRMQVIIRPFA